MNAEQIKRDDEAVRPDLEAMCRSIADVEAGRVRPIQDVIADLQSNATQAVSFLEGLEAAARQKLAEKSDEQAVDEIIGTAWYS